jgi:hypothetical protein
MKRPTIFRQLRAFHDDQRGEVTTQQMLYLAIGAIVAAILYKFGKRLLDIVTSFLDPDDPKLKESGLKDGTP